MNYITNSGHNQKGKRGYSYYPYGGHKHLGQWNNINRRHKKWNVCDRHNKENAKKEKILPIMMNKFIINAEEKGYQLCAIVRINI